MKIKQMYLISFIITLICFGISVYNQNYQACFGLFAATCYSLLLVFEKY